MIEHGSLRTTSATHVFFLFVYIWLLDLHMSYVQRDISSSAFAVHSLQLKGLFKLGKTCNLSWGIFIQIDFPTRLGYFWVRCTLHDGLEPVPTDFPLSSSRFTPLVDMNFCPIKNFIHQNRLTSYRFLSVLHLIYLINKTCSPCLHSMVKTKANF